MKILKINVFYWIDLCPWYIHTWNDGWRAISWYNFPFCFSFSASFNHHSNRKALIMSCKQWQCLRTSDIESRNYVVSNISYYYYLLIVRKWISIYSCINEMPHIILNMRLCVYHVSCIHWSCTTESWYPFSF